MDQDKPKKKTISAVIAMPPLRMVLVHAKDKPVGKAVLAAVIKRIAPRSAAVIPTVDPKLVKRLIKHLENDL